MSAHERHGGTRPTPSLASAQPGTTPGPGPTDRAPARSSPGLPTPLHALGRTGRPGTNTWPIRAPRLGPARGRPGGRRRRLQRSEHATRTAASGAAIGGHCHGRAGRPEPLYLRALVGREAELGPTHPQTLESVNNLAILLHDQGKHGEAEPLCRRALAEHEAEQGPTHPQIIKRLSINA